ncbi:MAG: Uma2 family endonuclease, partial [Lachnospiraceae bacterium]
FRYRDAGVKEYWIVDPTKNTVRIYDFIKNETEDYPFEAAIPSALFPGLTLRLANY